jgi:tRNA modification GTPase
MTALDTIVAVSTPPGKGGVGIVRVSGPKTPNLVPLLFKKKRLLPRKASFCSFYGKEGVLDQGLVLFFPAPHSFTGESVLEFHGHGNPVIQEALLAEVLLHGVRLAEPGEFSKRSYLNDKIDLAQAEAVADLIHATTLRAAKMALRSLSGVFSDKIHQMAQELLNLRVYVEAAIDFSDEEIDFLGDTAILTQMISLETTLMTTMAQANQGCRVQEGLRVAIVGVPNVGKSSLFNALVQQNAAIVTNIPGTTRDVLKEIIFVEGISLHLMDTAGLRETNDVVECLGVEKSYQTMAEADVLLWVVDETTEAELPPLDDKNWRVLNKADETKKPVGQVQKGCFRLSAKTGAGIATLKEALVSGYAEISEEEGGFTARKRHVEALKAALEALQEAKRQLQDYRALELAAEDLKRAHQFLGDITGRVTSDALLGEIFSSFCIGK